MKPQQEIKVSSISKLTSHLQLQDGLTQRSQLCFVQIHLLWALLPLHGTLQQDVVTLPALQPSTPFLPKPHMAPGEEFIIFTHPGAFCGGNYS